MREIAYFPPLEEAALEALRRALEEQRRRDDEAASALGLLLNRQSYSQGTGDAAGSEAADRLANEVSPPSSQPALCCISRADVSVLLAQACAYATALYV